MVVDPSHTASGEIMARLFLLPGDLVCDALGLEGDSDHRQILRTYANILIWGALATYVGMKTML